MQDTVRYTNVHLFISKYTTRIVQMEDGGPSLETIIKLQSYVKLKGLLFNFRLICNSH